MHHNVLIYKTPLAQNLQEFCKLQHYSVCIVLVKFVTIILQCTE